MGKRLATEELLPGNHFAKDGAPCPDVGAVIDWLPAGLLRAHISRGAHNDADLSGGKSWRVAVFRARGCNCLLYGSEAEVQHLDHSLGRDHDVARLQVAVNDSFFMSGFQSDGNLFRVVGGDLGRQWAVQR